MWNPALHEFEKALEFGGVNHVRIYYVMRALASVDMLDESVTKGLVNYTIKRGYDAEDLLTMNVPDKSNLRRAVHLIMLISYSKPDIKNKHLNNMLVAFTKEAIELKSLQPMQSFELFKALRNLKHFKADNLLKTLRKQSFANLIGEGVSE